MIASTFNKCVVDYLELNLGEEAGRAVELKAWPPTRLEDLVTEALPTEPRVNTPATNVTIASFASFFSRQIQLHDNHNSKCL